MKNRIVFLILMFGVSINVFGSGGSLYTRYGVGDLYVSHTAMHLSMGGLGTSLYNSKYVNFTNPATLSSIKNTRFGAGFNTNVSMLDDGTSKATYSHVKFTGFHIAFPLKETWGIGFVMGMLPYSVVNYEVNNSVTGDDDDNFGTFEEKFEGVGGISKLFFGTSYILPGDISIGASFDYYTGDIQYQSTFLYADASNLYDSFFTSDYKYKGLGGTIGILSPDLSKLFHLENISNFRLGITYETSGGLNTDTSLVAQTTIGENSFETGRVDTKLPSKLSFGLNLTISEKYLLVFDYAYQPWSEFELNGSKSTSLRDLTRLSFGFEIGEQTKRFASFWELVKYRGGLSYEQSQYEINGKGVDQLGIHAGISFPLGLENSIDIGFMYGFRGETDFNLVKEDIFQATISLNFGELWFLRREW